MESATLSVILEPLFIMAGALGLALLNAPYPGLQGLSLGLILLAVHPRVLNLIWRWSRRFRGQEPGSVACSTIRYES